MATSTKQTSQALPQEKDYHQGALYISNEGNIYLCTDEGTFVVVHNRNIRSPIGIVYQEDLPSDEVLELFEGSVTLTEGK